MTSASTPPMLLRKKLIAGNWKMNKTSADAVSLVKEIVAAVGKVHDVEVVVCPPFTSLESVARVLEGSALKLGAQNMHPEPGGAYTGEISAAMLRALFASYVILGHSERRTYFKETDAFINQKVLAALKSQLKPILCVGETLQERESGATLKVVQTQVEQDLDGVGKDLATNVVIAYEPVWAIGTGKTATTQQAQDAHKFIRGVLASLFDAEVARKVRIQYGGSVKPNNAKELMGQPDVDGALVGGASLEARSFADIIKNSI